MTTKNAEIEYLKGKLASNEERYNQKLKLLDERIKRMEEVN